MKSPITEPAPRRRFLSHTSMGLGALGAGVKVATHALHLIFGQESIDVVVQPFVQNMFVHRSSAFFTRGIRLPKRGPHLGKTGLTS